MNIHRLLVSALSVFSSGRSERVWASIIYSCRWLLRVTDKVLMIKIHITLCFNNSAKHVKVFCAKCKTCESLFTWPHLIQVMSQMSHCVWSFEMPSLVGAMMKLGLILLRHVNVDSDSVTAVGDGVILLDGTQQQSDGTAELKVCSECPVFCREGSFSKVLTFLKALLAKG